MLSLLAASGAAAPIHWADLGLRPGIELGFFTLRFYSLAYLFGVIFAYWHTSKMLKEPGAPMAQRHADDLFFYCTLGVIVGGRLGYAAFYTGGETGIPSAFTDFSGEGLVSWKLLRLWDGGMAFHGGLIGVTLAMAFVAWRDKLNFIRVVDYVSVGVPMGMLLGRLANFVNGELWGRPTDMPWGVAFPGAGQDCAGVIGVCARHPSQLYEAALEGLLLGAVLLWGVWRRGWLQRPGRVLGVFLAGYGAARFFVEFFREADAQFVTPDNPGGAVLLGMQMGQVLSLPMIALGLWFALRRR
ncbi:MAG: prolipoprotein diacylglyceryl transferase [Gemmobacter sp.]